MAQIDKCPNCDASLWGESDACMFCGHSFTVTALAVEKPAAHIEEVVTECQTIESATSTQNSPQTTQTIETAEIEILETNDPTVDSLIGSLPIPQFVDRRNPDRPLTAPALVAAVMSPKSIPNVTTAAEPSYSATPIAAPNADEPRSAEISPEDKQIEVDDEYRQIFNETALVIADLPFNTEDERVSSLQVIQERIHQLDSLIKKSKIQIHALRASKESRLAFVNEPNRRKLAEQDRLYEIKKRAPRTTKTSDGRPKVPGKASKADTQIAVTLGIDPSNTKAVKAAATMLNVGIPAEVVKAKLKDAGLL